MRPAPFVSQDGQNRSHQTQSNNAWLRDDCNIAHPPNRTQRVLVIKQINLKGYRPGSEAGGKRKRCGISEPGAEALGETRDSNGRSADLIRADEHATGIRRRPVHPGLVGGQDERRRKAVATLEGKREGIRTSAAGKKFISREAEVEKQDRLKAQRRNGQRHGSGLHGMIRNGRENSFLAVPSINMARQRINKQ